METAHKLQLRFWGVRGSTPSPGKDTLVYGGNTPCVEIRTASNQILVFDGGSGIRELGRQLAAEFAGRDLPLNLFLTHFHWDHIQGLPFFEPAYTVGNAFTLVGPAQPTADLVQILAGQMASVYFPVGLEQFCARMEFQEIDEGSCRLGGIQIDTLYSFHPGRSLIYRISHAGKRVVYATDNELPLGWKAAGGAVAYQV